MENLIKALQIFIKYGDIKYPTHCEHDILMVHYNPNDFSKEDIEKLSELGFNANLDEDCFYSFRYGSS